MNRLACTCLVVVLFCLGVLLAVAVAVEPPYTPLEQRIRDVANADADRLMEGLRAGMDAISPSELTTFLEAAEPAWFPYDIEQDGNDGHSEVRRLVWLILLECCDNGEQMFEDFANDADWKEE